MTNMEGEWKMVGWKVKKVGEKVLVKPILAGNAKGNVWFKKVKEIDWSKDNGYAFIGEFMPWWLWSEVVDGDIVLYVDKRTGEAQVYKFENEKMNLVGRYDYKSAFEMLRKGIDRILTGGEVEVKEEVQEVNEDEVEKLVVEFGVEKTVKHEYGYAEKYLKFRGEKIPYKAILKNGSLLAIVSRGYHLVENERLEEIVRKYANEKGYLADVVWKSLRRIHMFVKPNEESDIAAVIHNSVDGSMALRIDLAIKLNGVYTVFKVRRFQQVYKRHTKNVEKFINELTNAIDVILGEAEEYKKFIEQLGNFKIKDMEQDVRDFIEAGFPKKHWEPVWYKYKKGEVMTLKQMYEELAKKVWQDNRLDFKTKVDRFDKLNEIMVILSRYSGEL